MQRGKPHYIAHVTWWSQSAGFFVSILKSDEMLFITYN